MTKQEFLDELKTALAGEVSTAAVYDAVNYYSTYIEDEIRQGKSEADAVEALGKPALIARSIIAAQTGERVADEVMDEDGHTKRGKRRSYEKTTNAGAGGTYKEKKQRVSDPMLPYKIGLALIGIIVLLILLLVLVVVVKVGGFFLSTLGIPVLLVLGIIYLAIYFNQGK